MELAPGVFLEDKVVASKLAVPPPKSSSAPPQDPLERLRWERKTTTERTVLQLGHFPNITSEAPPNPSTERPVHPDEICGPWVADITYDAPDGAAYGVGLGLTSIDGAEVRA